jgi:hypothetical protein
MQQSPQVIKYLLAMRLIIGTHGMHGDETNVRHGPWAETARASCG